jgi:hypothetical protein
VAQEEGGEVLLDVLRRWVVIKQRRPLGMLEKPLTPDAVVRFSQGELSAFRALERILSNPSETLKRLLNEQMKDEING